MDQNWNRLSGSSDGLLKGMIRIAFVVLDTIWTNIPFSGVK